MTTQRTGEQLLADIEYYNDEIARALREYHKLPAPSSGTVAPLSERLYAQRNRPTAVVKWAEWLADNNPTTGEVLKEMTGVQLRPNAKDHILGWNLSADGPDDTHTANQLFSIKENAKPGGGRPCLIYFRWDQRYDVYQLHGVGPVLGEAPELPAESPVSRLPSPSISALSAEHLIKRRNEWMDSHRGIFDLARAGTKLDVEQWKLLRETAPAGVDPSEIVLFTHKGTLDQLDQTLREREEIIKENLLRLSEQQQQEPESLPPAPISAAQRRMMEDAELTRNHDE